MLIEYFDERKIFVKPFSSPTPAPLWKYFKQMSVFVDVTAL